MYPASAGKAVGKFVYLTYSPRVEDVLAAGIGVAVAVILFVLIAFSGVRVDAANAAVTMSALSISALGFGLAAVLHMKSLAWTNLVCSVGLWVGMILGVLACFCIGGGCDRYENCEASYAPALSLLNAAVLLAWRGRLAGVGILSVLIGLPAVGLYVKWTHAAALRVSLAEFERSGACILWVDEMVEGWPDLSRSAHIDGAQSVNLPWMEAEAWPRYIVFEDGQVVIWKYGDRAFQQLYRWGPERIIPTIAAFCETDLDS